MHRIKFSAGMEQPASLSVRSSLKLVAVFEHPTAQQAFDGSSLRALSQQAEFSEFRGQHEKTMLVFPHSAGEAGGAQLLYGLGRWESIDISRLRESLIAAFKAAKKSGAVDLVLVLPPLAGSGISDQEFGESVALIATIVDYEVNHFKTAKGGHKAHKHFKSVHVTCIKDKEVRSGMRAGQIVGSAINNTRNLVNLPAGQCTPEHLASQARELERKAAGAISVKVLSRKQCAKLGMNAFLAVAQGSTVEPRFIELTYEPANAVSDVVLGLVGKSITFDSGGLDIKSAGGMRDMKCDMAGGATVLSAIGAIAALKLPVKVKAFMAATENMPGPRSYKPGDVIEAMGGLSVEVDNTDAEGRLTLIDAIEYARRAGCTHIVDLATLTGAILTSLADVGAGLFTNDPVWAQEVKASARLADELVWEMPMWAALKKGNESQLADLKNSGGTFGAGSSTAALFIAAFAQGIPWVHLDIAGVAMRGRELGADPKGGTGWGVRTLVNLARRLSGK